MKYPTAAGLDGWGIDAIRMVGVLPAGLSESSDAALEGCGPAPVLWECFNLVECLGRVPSAWMVVRTHLLPKTDSPSLSPGDLRPISLLVV
eukprot:529942-Amphidinium_carterae.1